MGARRQGGGREEERRKEKGMKGERRTEKERMHKEDEKTARCATVNNQVIVGADDHTTGEITPGVDGQNGHILHRQGGYVCVPQLLLLLLSFVVGFSEGNMHSHNHTGTKGKSRNKNSPPFFSRNLANLASRSARYEPTEPSSLLLGDPLHQRCGASSEAPKPPETAISGRLAAA